MVQPAPPIAVDLLMVVEHILHQVGVLRQEQNGVIVLSVVERGGVNIVVDLETIVTLKMGNVVSAVVMVNVLVAMAKEDIRYDT